VSNDDWWEPGQVTGARPRRQPVRAVVVHHTAGERGAAAVCATLRARRLSIHFVVDFDGRVTQHADPATTVTYHAGAANSWSVGIEIVSRGVAPPTGRVREIYEDRVHGRKVRFLRFFPEQIKAAQVLCEELCERFGLPLQVPTWRGGELVKRVLTASEQREFHGVCGHYHLSTRKVDPGTAILEELSAAWLKRA